MDVADPTELPLCWYGVPFVRDLIYPYTERIGLASYYTREVLRAQPGDLDTFQTWANLEVWFQKQSGLKLDLNLVWGQPTPILTFCSNHESSNVTKEQLSLICDLLDDMDYGDEYQLKWYLDRNLDVSLFFSSLIAFSLTILDSIRRHPYRRVIRPLTRISCRRYHPFVLSSALYYHVVT